MRLTLQNQVDLFGCFMNHSHKTGNLFVDYAPFIYDPDTILDLYFEQGNCIKFYKRLL